MGKKLKDVVLREDTQNWQDEVEMLELSKEFQTIRIIGDAQALCRYYVKFVTKAGKEGGFYAPCFSFNSETETMEGEDIGIKAKLKPQVLYVTNCILRSAQESKPAKAAKETPNKKGFRVKDQGWSPVRVVQLPKTAVRLLQDISNLNKHKVNGVVKTFDTSDPQYGVDVEISFNPKADTPAAMYSVQKGEKSALTEEEQEYLLFDLSIVPNFLNSQKPGDKYYEDRLSYEKQIKRLHPECFDVEDDEMPTAKPFKRATDEDDDYVPKKSNKVVPKFEDEDEKPSKAAAAKRIIDEDDDDMPKKKKVVEEDEDEKPRRKKPVEEDEDLDEPEKKVVPAKKRPAVVEEDEDEQPEPVKKKPAPSVKPKKVVEEDEDEEEPEVPVTKKKKVVEEEEEDDDEDGPKVQKASSKKKFEYDDDDEAEEATPKTSKSKTKSWY